MNTNKSEKQKLAERAIVRGSSGLYFLEECLRDSTGGTDGAYSRSRYILLSFNFELILKARLILASHATSRDGIINPIRTHDLEKLSKKLSVNELADMGIKSIKKRETGGFTEYVVTMSDKKKILIQDLVDVRYDFVKDNLRNTDPDEVNRIKGEIEVLHAVVKKIQRMIPF